MISRGRDKFMATELEAKEEVILLGASWDRILTHPVCHAEGQANFYCLLYGSLKF